MNQTHVPFPEQKENNTYNLLDEIEEDWEKIVAKYKSKNNKENREKLEQKNKERKDIKEKVKKIQWEGKIN